MRYNTNIILNAQQINHIYTEKEGILEVQRSDLWNADSRHEHKIKTVKTTGAKTRDCSECEKTRYLL